jgi:hypothetical protein
LIQFAISQIYHFTGVKTHPEITNLPDSASFPEDTSAGTALFTAAISNPDVGETTTVTVRVDPNSELSVFTLDTSSKNIVVLIEYTFALIYSYCNIVLYFRLPM